MTAEELAARLGVEPSVVQDLAMYVNHFGLEEVRKGETEPQLRERVAVWLRNNGHIIEAHEVNAGPGARWDSSPGVMAGIAGALAVEMGKHEGFGTDTRAGLDAEVPIGLLAMTPPDPRDEALRTLLEMGLPPDFLLGGE